MREGKQAAFILTHGRADNVVTYKTLRKDGYTGEVFIIIDNEDDQEELYRKNFGDQVVVFDKKAISETFDTADLSEDRRSVVYARNAAFQIAKDLGIRWFVELDDDYTSFNYPIEKDGKMHRVECRNLDRLFNDMFDFLAVTKARVVAISQGGDFIGGVESKRFKEHVLRKAMNTLFCDADSPITFLGRINEDVNTYVTLGMRGELVLSITDAAINQKNTQENSGGMTELYIDNGTYLKSWYSVMFQPSCVKIGVIDGGHKRLHHHVSWGNCVSMILSERWKK